MSHPVAVGNIYESVGAWKSRWQVKQVIEKPGYPTHARLISTENRMESKLIAIAALQDRSKFSPIAIRQGNSAEQ